MVSTACEVGNQITPVLSWKVGGGAGASPPTREKNMLDITSDMLKYECLVLPRRCECLCERCTVLQ